MSNRINPAQVTGTITATGTAHAIGPYKFRVGSSIKGINVTVYSTNTTDVVSIVGVPPDTDFTSANNQVELNASIGCPSVTNFNGASSLLATSDMYVYATTCTGTITVIIEKVSATSRV